MPTPERRDTRRRFEQWARNPECMANTISAVRGISMEEVARAEGLTSTMGQSPFAITRGQGFERAVFGDGAKRLRTELARCGLLPEESRPFLDLRLKRFGGSSTTLDDSLASTEVLLKQMAIAPPDDPRIPAIVTGAAISIPGGAMLPEALLVIDVALLRWPSGTPEVMVGEIKTYPDRAGYTDGAELATARAQAGVYVHGLEVVLTQWGLSDRLTVAREGFLVLSRPGFSVPSIRAGEDLRYQVERARRGLARLRQIATAGLGEGDPITAVREADCAYSEACLGFCDRVSGCYERAVAASDPVVLGEEVRRFLGPVSLDRAKLLLSGAPAANDVERDVAERLREAGALLTR